MDEQSHRAVEVAEQSADGRATEDQLAAVRAQAAAPSSTADYAAWATTDPRGQEAAREAANDLPHTVAWSVADYHETRWDRAHEAEGAAQSRLLRDIVGNPFGAPLVIAPSVLQWNGGIVKCLAEAAYEQRTLPSGALDSARLAMLADALEEAGCQDEEMLRHLRQQDAVHVRGCWVVDTLLAKS
jgi:hypothetical protein